MINTILEASEVEDEATSFSASPVLVTTELAGTTDTGTEAETEDTATEQPLDISRGGYSPHDEPSFNHDDVDSK